MNLFTIIAQLINFSVLIYLLNKFLYKPVLATLEKRREDIKSKMEEIEDKLKESDKLKEEYLSKLKNLEKENSILKEKAVKEANEIKELELQKARQDLSEKKDRFNEYLNLEQQKLVENFNENLGELFINYSNNIFKSIANTNLDNEIANRMIENVNCLDNEKIEEINKLNPDIIEIITSFEVNKEQQDNFEKAFKNKKINFSKIKYACNKDLILGIEVKIKSFVLSWNLKELTENFLKNING